MFKLSPVCYSLLLTGIFATHCTLAEEQSHSAKTADKVETIEVRVLRKKLEQSGRLKDTIIKTEVLDRVIIEQKNALSLSEAIQDEPGVKVSNECSMCGVKRVMMNGLKGDHTTILVDGIPTHTLISGFYAVDAIATTGIDRIEIARGSGASLIAPEAIGGTINIVSKEALQDSLELDFAGGSHQFRTAKLFGSLVSDDGLTGLTIVGQYDTQDQEDHDDNLVSESPFVENQSLTARLSHDFNDSNNVQLRYSNIQAEIFGGPILGKNVESVGALLASYDGEPLEQLFENNDVRNRYIGKPWQTTEWIETTRDESYIKWLSEINDQWLLEIAYSTAEHEQNSFYEGIDYWAQDTMDYVHVRADYLVDFDHAWRFGVEKRNEAMRSRSNALQHLADYVSDSFNYDTQALFAQYHYSGSDKIEVAAALRYDSIEADFIDPSKPGIEIDRSLFSPRVDLRYFHSDLWTSRLSVGQGFRAPLSFFESDHGILDSEKGFQIDVSEPERSLSVNYALSYDSQSFSATFSAASSTVKHLATLSETEEGVPLLTQLSNKATVSTVDVVLGWSITSALTLNAAVEKFIYDDTFKSSYGIAPVEERLGLDLIYIGERIEANMSWTWFGSRDLSQYGYEGYDVLGDVSTLKSKNAGAFSVTNGKLKYNLSDSQNVYVGVSNLFNTLQFDDGQTPLFFDSEGSYDVAYIYGALHGREWYAGYQINF